jgi:hypothetical protein
LFGRLAKGGHVKVGLKDGKLTFDIDHKAAPPVPARDSSASEEPVLAE